jgi:hypothetical protein
MFLVYSKPAVQPPPVCEPEASSLNQGAVEKILPGRKEVFNIAQNKYTYSQMLSHYVRHLVLN